MDLTPYLDSLRSDLTATVSAAGEEVSRAGTLLAGALDASVRLCLLEALSDATAEITTKLRNATVEVRLHGREADFVVSDPPGPDMAPTGGVGPSAPPSGEPGDLARVTLRLPEPLKDQIDRAAEASGMSVNAWVVRALSFAVAGGPTPPPGRGRGPRRVTGFAQA